MRLYSRGQQKQRWNDPMKSNVKIEAQANVGLLGINEGIG
jgi:hypothetical protein